MIGTIFRDNPSEHGPEDSTAMGEELRRGFIHHAKITFSQKCFRWQPQKPYIGRYKHKSSRREVITVQIQKGEK